MDLPKFILKKGYKKATQITNVFEFSPQICPAQFLKQISCNLHGPL